MAKPVDTLIKKISEAAGILYEPTRIRRKSKAEADAVVIAAKAEMEIEDLQEKRILEGLLAREKKYQENTARIVDEAMRDLKEDADPGGMDDDWVANFFDKARLVSDAEMQSLWACVLSGEANGPGSYAKRTVNLIAELDKRDAEQFTRLCGFVCVVGGMPVPLIFDNTAEVYTRQGVNYEALNHLDSIGLVNFNDIAGHSVTTSGPVLADY